jgi:hypothetical protein
MGDTFQALLQFKVVMKDGKPDIQVLRKFITEVGAPIKKKRIKKDLLSEDIKEVEM